MHDAETRTWLKLRDPRDPRMSMQWIDERGARIRLLSSTMTTTADQDGIDRSTAPASVQAAPTS